MALTSLSSRRIIVGLGQTGMSVVRYLVSRKLPFSVVDSRLSPPNIDQLYRYYPEIPVFLGNFHRDVLMGADELIVSPGIALVQPDIAAALSFGVKVLGDIELFCRAVTDTPIVAITGSNGKSTVTSLLGEMAQQAGVKVAVGGNIGIPVLDLLEPAVDLYILELSSFQLETTESLCAAAATVLNVSPDHMDRYSSIASYQGAKHKIYKKCKAVIYNLDDPLSAPCVSPYVVSSGFTSGDPKVGQFGLRMVGGSVWLCKGMLALLDTSELRIYGRHNHLNVLAALALGEAISIQTKFMLEAIRQFAGLPHRCQWLANINGVRWFNDSKATNVGACIAAIVGLGDELLGNIILIAGGEGKDACFLELQSSIRQYVRHVILIGKDADLLNKVLYGCAAISRADNLREAVIIAQQVSRDGDGVLLSPACASFDMFESFEDRGEQFGQLVQEHLRNELNADD